MKTTLPAPGTTVVSLLADITSEQLKTLNSLDFGTVSEHDTVHGPLPDEALRLLYLRTQVRNDSNTLIEEINAASRAHEQRHSQPDFNHETECAAYHAAVDPMTAELSTFRSYLETLSGLMWATIRIHYSIYSEEKGVLTLLSGPDGPIAVQSPPKDEMPEFGFELIEISLGVPEVLLDRSGAGGGLLSRFFPGGFPGRSRPKAPASAS